MVASYLLNSNENLNNIPELSLANLRYKMLFASTKIVNSFANRKK